MKILFAFLGTLSLLMSTCGVGAMAQTTDSAPALQKDITWDNTPAKHKLLKLHRVVMQIPTAEPVGAGYRDLTCAFDKYPIYIRRTGDQIVSDFSGAFDEQLAAAGYTSPSTALFADAGAPEANLWVGAAITELNIKSCGGFGHGLLTSSMGTSSTAQITVEWQLYDPLERKVVFKGTSQGQANTHSDPHTASEVAMRAAFAQAARAVLAMPDFQTAALVQTDQQPTPGAAAQAFPTAVTIPTLPPSTTLFTSDVKSRLNQVVTVLTSSGSGSGFYIADGLLLTNHHVAPQGTPVKIRLSSGEEIPGQSIASNGRRDVALIHTDNIGVKGLPLHAAIPDLGSKVFVIGSPMGEKFEGTLSSGIVSAVREYEHKNFIQSDVAVTHGSSGGPMFDEKGNVVGITDLGKTDPNSVISLNFFIPIAEALESVNITQQPAAMAAMTPRSASKHKTAP